MCDHVTFCFDPSTHASRAGYRRPRDKDDPALETDVGGSFPAPLVLPGDDLAEDPEYPPQTVEEWESEEERNPVTKRRRTIYVAPPPSIPPDVNFMEPWTRSEVSEQSPESVPSPHAQDVVDYLAAFYHGMKVVLLPKKLSFVAWDEKAKKGAGYVGLNIGTEVVRIRTRSSLDIQYRGQLNSDDMLDAAASLLPKDAFTLMLLTNHDLYEHDEDDFLCGRAYGGSRIAVVSMARYNPQFDSFEHVDSDHPWPVSHCQQFSTDSCRQTKASAKKRKRTNTRVTTHPDSARTSGPGTSPILNATTAHRDWSTGHPKPCEAISAATWLARVCRTASHELGHCFGIDHCTYYACVMQGTGSLAEDARQPPYLCPVDALKISRATGTGSQQQYRALLAFCEKQGQSQMFTTFAAWLRARLAM